MSDQENIGSNHGKPDNYTEKGLQGTPVPQIPTNNRDNIGAGREGSPAPQIPTPTPEKKDQR